MTQSKVQKLTDLYCTDQLKSFMLTVTVCMYLCPSIISKVLLQDFPMQKFLFYL